MKAILPPQQFWRHKCSIACPIGLSQAFHGDTEVALHRWRERINEVLVIQGSISSPQFCSFLIQAQLIAPTKLEELWTRLLRKRDATTQGKGFPFKSHSLPRSSLDFQSDIPGVGLLPFSPYSSSSLVRTFASQLVISRTTSRDFANLCLRLTLLMIKSLNFLACAGWTDSPVCLECPSDLSPAQRTSLRHLFDSAFHFLDTDLKHYDVSSIRNNLSDMQIGYNGDVVTTRKPLIADLVKPAWPKAGKACLFPIVNFLTPELQDDINNPERCLLPKEQWPDHPPSCKVYASNEEWYELVKYGAHIGLFGEIAEEEIFKDQHGNVVLNGAIGVDKVKTVNGVDKMCLRFISNFIPINSYLRKLRGDSKLLPCVTQLGLILLEDGELLQLESEDMESCFNLFYLPKAWAGYCAYAKKVPQSAFGGSPNVFSYAYIKAVPMGCTFAVDVMQCMARKYVFKLCQVPSDTELNRNSSLPDENISLVCLDGFDYIRKTNFSSLLGKGAHKNSAEHEKFVRTSHSLGLPLNAAKSLVKAFKGPILGGEVDGLLGRVQHARDKGFMIMATTLTLLSKDLVTQANMQHWAGIACFAAGFRRPSFSVLESIFTFISSESWVRYPSQPIPLDVIDEMLCFCGILPLCYTNLRAPIRPKISISDASEQGGGAAEATHFTELLDPRKAKEAEDWFANICEESAFADQPNNFCSVCGSSDPDWGKFSHCPHKCGETLCSTTCLLHHLNTSCISPQLFLPSFGEGFCGPRAPLTWAIANTGTKVIAPFDKAYTPGDDFFTKEGRSSLQRFDQPDVAFEHWGPDCKLMSAARGRPIILKDGSWVQGPQAVRSPDFPLGLPNLRGEMKERVKKSNAMFMHALKRIHWRSQNWGFAAAEHPLNSLGWHFPLAKQLLATIGIFFTIVWNCCNGGKRKKGTGILHNCPQLHHALHSEYCAGHAPGELLDYTVGRDSSGSLVFDTESEAEYPWGLCLAYAQSVQAALKEWQATTLPATLSDQNEWLLNSLRYGATKRLAKYQVSDVVAPILMRLIESMQPGKELSHLKFLLRAGDYRGSDVIISSQEVLAEDRQLSPYPAFAWQWKSVQGYSWAKSQHINVLEFAALLNYIRSIVKHPKVHAQRLFHVLDSRVCSCIVAKGRSSSRLLNRLCRRYASFILAADLYVLPLWTISKWNYSDAASRHVRDYAA